MRFGDLFEASEEEKHFDAYDKTGYYGKQGAGCIFLARSTKKILLCHRSSFVLQPHTWGSWGGALNTGETPLEGARREAFEEAGYRQDFNIVPLLVFKDKSFRYHNFLVVVDEEFSPTLDWESQGFKWCDFGNWPLPLHFGLQALFGDPNSVHTIEQAIAQENPA